MWTEQAFTVPYGARRWVQEVPNPIGLDAEIELFHTDHAGRLSSRVIAPPTDHTMDVYASTVVVQLAGQDIGGNYRLRLR